MTNHSCGVGPHHAEPGAERNNEMTEAPERIWVHYEPETDDAQWTENNDLDGFDEYKHYGKYIRADHVDDLLKAEREKALREAAKACEKLGKKAEGEPYGWWPSVCKKAIESLISEDKTDG